MNKFVEVPFTRDIDENNLSIVKAKEACKAIKELNHMYLIKCSQRDDGWQFITFETNIQLPQRGIINDIKLKERLAIGFHPQDLQVPEVLALRYNFPTRLPHTNLKDFERPVSLCLFDIPYDEVKLTFTVNMMLERIRNWLKLTAIGKLHQDTQYLEPFLYDNDGIIIIPTDFGKYPLNVKQIGTYLERPILIAENEKNSKLQNQFAVIYMRGKKHVHGTFNYKPSNSKNLSDILRTIGINFKSELINALNNCNNLKLINFKLLICVIMPKTKSKVDNKEEIDNYIFYTDNTIKEIGILIGLWEEHTGFIAPILNFKTNENLDNKLLKIKIKTVLPQFIFNKKLAQFSNNITPKFIDKNILVIGVGSLGSQIVNNLSRQGIGNWTIVDNDVLFPHNLARHSLLAENIGKNKSQSISEVINNLFPNETISKAENIDVTDICNLDKLKELLNNVDIILDFSASVSVARYLSQIAHKSVRIISCFLNPNGSDLVIIAEDEKQNRRIDYLEMVYYRGLLNNKSLSNHLKRTTNKKYYARSCRDLTYSIPQEYFSIFSGIAAGEIKNILNKKNAEINIFHLDTKCFQVQKISFTISKILYKFINNWDIYYDQQFIEKLTSYRKLRLPNETGGIILGNYDIQRNKIYLVDTILSPEDSEEYPNSYKRGIKNLDIQFDQLSAATSDNLRYVGEWHSHPNGHSTHPSQDDKINFEWIRSILKNEGLPPLSLIIGDNSNHSIYVTKM